MRHNPVYTGWINSIVLYTHCWQTNPRRGHTDLHIPMDSNYSDGYMREEYMNEVRNTIAIIRAEQNSPQWLNVSAEMKVVRLQELADAYAQLLLAQDSKISTLEAEASYYHHTTEEDYECCYSDECSETGEGAAVSM